MDKGKITHLSGDGFDRLFAENAKNLPLVMQFLGKIDRKIGDKPFLKAIISNGFFKSEAFIHPDNVEQFVQTVRVNDILQLLVSRRPNTSQLLIGGFEIVYTNLELIVGSPIDFEEGAKNKSGSSLIAEVTKKDAAQPLQNSKVNDYVAEGAKYNLEVEDEKPAAYYMSLHEMTPFDKDFTVRGRLLKKEAIRSFKNRQGHDSQLFSFILFDGDIEVQGTFFGTSAQKYFPVMEEGEVYMITHCEVKSDDKFNSTNFKYTLSFGRNAEVKKLRDTHRIPKYNFRFVQLDQIEEKKEKDKVDIIAIVGQIGDLMSITTKAGQKMDKREVVIYDDSKVSMKLMLWREPAKNITFKKDDIIIIKNAVVEEFQGKQIGFSFGSQIITALPDHPRMKSLLVFQKSGGQALVTQVKTNQYHKFGALVDIIELENLAYHSLSMNPAKRPYWNIKAKIMMVPSNIFYDSCGGEKCKRKVEKQDDGRYYCKFCNIYTKEATPRFFTNITVGDTTCGIRLLVSMDRLCVKLFRKPINELVELKKNKNDLFDDYLKMALFKTRMMRISANIDQYNGKSEVRFSLIEIGDVQGNAKAVVKQYLQAFKNARHN